MSSYRYCAAIFGICFGTFADSLQKLMLFFKCKMPAHQRYIGRAAHSENVIWKCDSANISQYFFLIPSSYKIWQHSSKLLEICMLLISPLWPYKDTVCLGSLIRFWTHEIPWEHAAVTLNRSLRERNSTNIWSLSSTSVTLCLRGWR